MSSHNDHAGRLSRIRVPAATRIIESPPPDGPPAGDAESDDHVGTVAAQAAAETQTASESESEH